MLGRLRKGISLIGLIRSIGLSKVDQSHNNLIMLLTSLVPLLLTRSSLSTNMCEGCFNGEEAFGSLSQCEEAVTYPSDTHSVD